LNEFQTRIYADWRINADRSSRSDARSRAVKMSVLWRCAAHAASRKEPFVLGLFHRPCDGRTNDPRKSAKSASIRVEIRPTQSITAAQTPSFNDLQVLRFAQDDKPFSLLCNLVICITSPPCGTDDASFVGYPFS
jgi:hypothetical protein